MTATGLLIVVLLAIVAGTAGFGRATLILLLVGCVMVGLYHSRAAAPHAQVVAPQLPPAAETSVADPAKAGHRIVAELEPDLTSAPIPVAQTDQPSEVVKPAEDVSSRPRPAWVDSAPALRPDGSFVTHVEVGPYASIEECQGRLDAAIEEAVHDYIENALWQEEPDAARVELPLAYSGRAIRARLAGEDLFLERREHSFGSMYTLHARVAFDRAAQGQLQDLKKQAAVNRRLRQTGLGSLLTLALLGTAFGYLKLDTATRGSYTRRLQVGAGLVTAGLVAAGVAALG